MQPLISVIVPVYNVEDYLARCLDSLSKQSLADIEVLIIDDASPDRSSAICEEYVAKDIRFKLIHHQVNKGLSEARNTGIAHASAPYLMFVDSDDWVHKDFCKAAYECAVHYQADLVMFGCQIEKKLMFFRQYYGVKRSLKSGYKTRLEALDLMRGFKRGVGNAAWNKLYRKELFYNISYPPGYLFEDVGTTYKIIWQASHIYYLNKTLYYYCYRSSSITALKTRKALYDRFELYMQQYSDLAEWGYPREKLDALLKNIAIDYCIKKKPDETDSRYMFCANILHKTANIPKQFTWERKILFVLYRRCPFLFEWVCEAFDKRFQ